MLPPVRFEISTEIVFTAVLEADTITKPAPAPTGTVTPVASELVACTKTLYAVVIPVAAAQLRNAVVLAVMEVWAISHVPKIIPASVEPAPSVRLVVLATDVLNEVDEA